MPINWDAVRRHMGWTGDELESWRDHVEVDNE